MVTVQYYKYPDLPHWGFRGHLLGEDGHGVWVGLPAGSPRWKGEVEWPPVEAPAAMCFPHRGWWTLLHNGPGPGSTHFVDITTQPRWNEERVEMVDLDLDVVRRADGAVEVEDEDEFAVHQVRYGYSPAMIRRARSETDRIFRMLTTGAEPFASVAASWLSQVSADQ